MTVKSRSQYSLITTICFTAFLLSCATLEEPSMNLNADVAPITQGQWSKPALQSTWHWQLTGTLNTAYSVDLYDVDLFDTSTAQIQQLQAQGRWVICYFSAGSYEQWREDVSDLSESTLGETLDGWADERWWDIRTEAVQAVIESRLQLALTKGCDGVEPDNMDAYQNDSGFSLTATDQLAFNRFVANKAHSLGLAVGLKNDLDQIAELVSYFDFAVNEQCFEYDECDTLTPFIEAGKPVLNAEYKSLWVNDTNARANLCNDANQRQFSTLILPLNLDDSFRHSCL